MTINKETVLESSAKAELDKMEPAPCLRFYNAANLPPVRKDTVEGVRQVVEGPIYDDSPSEALKRYNGLDSSMFPNNPSLPIFGDFSNMPNIAEASLIVNRARTMFDGLDSSIRAKFDNDFDKFGNYVNSDEFNPEFLMTEEFKNGVYRNKQLSEIKAKQQKDYDDWLLAHPNWKEEQEQLQAAQFDKYIEKYLKSKNILQG